MKTIPALAFALTALSAFVVAVPLSFEATLSVLFAAGLLGLLIADYSRGFGPARPQAAPALTAAQRSERLRLAA
jgi:hypothetical protein